MRLTYEELNKIKKQFDVDELWSFSKFNSYRTSHYEWYLKYILHKEENSDKPSAYAPLGGAVHDILEKYYNGELKQKDLFDEFDDIYTTNIEIVGLYFDRADSTKNTNIKDKYYKDLEHFFKNFQPSPYKSLMEQFVTIKVTDDIVFQGYMDCVHKEEDETYVITDFKTSTRYQGAKINKEAAQLLLYSEALRQKGIPRDKIKARWEFLKYVTIDCEQINGKIKERAIERYEIGEKLQASVKAWLKKLGYEDDMTEYLDALVQTNDIKCLPEDVRVKYKIHPCYVYVDNIWEMYEELKEEIIAIIAEIRDKTVKYNELKDIDLEAAEHLFWDDEESLKAESYYYTNLCGYSLATIKPYAEYLNKIKAEKEGNILGGSNNTKKDDEYDEDNLDWLADL